MQLLSTLSSQVLLICSIAVDGHTILRGSVVTSSNLLLPSLPKLSIGSKPATLAGSAFRQEDTDCNSDAIGNSHRCRSCWMQYSIQFWYCS